MTEFTLFPHQPKGIDFLATRRGGLLGDDPGAGKTVMAIEAAKNFRGPILIVCRPLAKPFWRAKIREWDPGAPIVTCIEGGVFHEPAVKPWFEFPRRRGYLIVHHEAVRIVTKQLARMGLWEIIIVDEAHRVGNIKTKVNRALRELQAFNKWALTATPMDKHPAEFFGVLKWFSPTEFGSYWDFFERYVHVIRNRQGRVVKVVPRNLEEFARIVKPYYLRRTAEEIGMFEPLRVTVPLDMYDGQAEVYANLKGSLMADIHSEDLDADPMFIPSVLSRMHKLKMCALDPSLIGSREKSVKVDWLKEYLGDNEDEPVVIFTHSRDFAKTLPSLIPGGVSIHGETSQAHRDLLLEKFQAGEIHYLVATADVAAESLNLQVSSKTVFTDIHPSSRTMTQAEMRTRRIDSKHRPEIFTLECEKSVDVHFRKMYEQKLSNRELVESFLMNGGHNV